MPIESTTQACRLPVDIEKLEKVFDDLLAPLAPVPFDTSCSSKTIYDILSADAQASSFFNLVTEHASLTELLQSEENGEHTVFVPINAADLGTPLVDALSMHILPHYMSVESFFDMPNVPTLLRSPDANGPQVLAARYSISKGWRLNGVKLVKGNIKAKNGIIHFVETVLAPKPDIISVIAEHRDLSFLSKAIRVTGLEDAIKGAAMKGKTIFGLHDGRFKMLGEETLRYLFDTEQGNKYLKAMVEYQVVPNTTFLTSLEWPKNDDGRRISSGEGQRKIAGMKTVSLDTMLVGEEGRPVPVELKLARYRCLISMEVAGYSKVMDSDILASDGVVQLVKELLLPRSLSEEELNDGIPTLAGITAALEPYV